MSREENHPSSEPRPQFPKITKERVEQKIEESFLLAVSLCEMAGKEDSSILSLETLGLKGNRVNRGFELG